MDVHLSIVDFEFALLEPFAPSVRGLAGDVVLQRVHLLGRKVTHDAAFGNAPELLFSHFCGENYGFYLSVDFVVFIVPVHKTTLCLFGHSVFHKRSDDLILVGAKAVTVELIALGVQVTVLISLKDVCHHRHIQLERFSLWLNEAEAILPRYE